MAESGLLRRFAKALSGLTSSSTGSNPVPSAKFMLGKLIGKTIRIATLPLDIVEIGLDYATGGDGSRDRLKSVMPTLSDVRDKVADVAEKIDD